MFYSKFIYVCQRLNNSNVHYPGMSNIQWFFHATEILLVSKNKWSIDTCTSVNEFQKFSAKWKKHTNKLYSDSVYMSYEKSQNKGTKVK